MRHNLHPESSSQLQDKPEADTNVNLLVIIRISLPCEHCLTVSQYVSMKMATASLNLRGIQRHILTAISGTICFMLAEITRFWTDLTLKSAGFFFFFFCTS